MSINADSIMRKVRAWEASPAGKERIGRAVSGLYASGKVVTAAGSKLLSAEDMEKAAGKLANAIIASAMSCGLPASVLGDVQSISATKPYKTKDGAWAVDLFFTSNLGRPSLYQEGYPDGVNNIIALFNNGYLAKDYVYGWWDGVKPDGRNLDTVYRSGVDSNDSFIRSRIGRPGTNFLQTAVNDFNSTVGAKIGAKAVLAPIYEEDPSYI